MYNASNFNIKTRAVWTETPKYPNRQPNFISPKGSKYWFTRLGVFRQSDHWGNVGACRWEIAGITSYTTALFKTCYCEWRNFFAMGEPMVLEGLTSVGKVALVERPHIRKIVVKNKKKLPRLTESSIFNDLKPGDSLLAWFVPKKGKVTHLIINIAEITETHIISKDGGQYKLENLRVD